MGRQSPSICEVLGTSRVISALGETLLLKLTPVIPFEQTRERRVDVMNLRTARGAELPIIVHIKCVVSRLDLPPGGTTRRDAAAHWVGAKPSVGGVYQDG